MRKKQKVLFFVDRLRLGGIQILFYEIIRNLAPHNNMEIEILMLDDSEKYPLEQTLRDMGVRIHQLKGVWMRTPLDLPNYFRAMDKFFDEHHDFDVVHMHSGSKNYYVLQSAAKHNIGVRVAHSHNTDFQTKNPILKLMGDMMKKPLRKYATHRCGCSTDACEWLFGQGSVKSGEAQVVLNGIDSSVFSFDETIRADVRRELGLENKFVIGHVGRFENQKNHTFLLDIFAEVVARNPESVLVLVGIGGLQSVLEQKAANLGIADKVKFLGFRADRERILQAADSFVFPSLYEGLPVTLIEAQVSGLPLFVSDSVTKDLSPLPRIQYLSLNESPQYWADKILAEQGSERRDLTTEVNNAGFGISTMIDNLYKMYTQK